MNVPVSQILSEILQDHFRLDISNIGPESRLNRDLGIDGDDAVELIILVESRLARKLDFEFSKYFSTESLFSRWKDDFTVAELIVLMNNAT